MGLVALQHVGSSQARAWTRVPCIGRWILNHCATREVRGLFNIDSLKFVETSVVTYIWSFFINALYVIEKNEQNFFIGEFILWVCWSLYIYVFKFGEFSAIISSNIFPVLISFCSPGTPVVQMVDLLIFFSQTWSSAKFLQFSFFPFFGLDNFYWSVFKLTNSSVICNG